LNSTFSANAVLGHDRQTLYEGDHFPNLLVFMGRAERRHVAHPDAVLRGPEQLAARPARHDVRQIGGSGLSPLPMSIGSLPGGAAMPLACRHRTPHRVREEPRRNFVMPGSRAPCDGPRANRRGVPTSRGGAWTADSVLKLKARCRTEVPRTIRSRARAKSVLAATLNREADAEIARILRCQEGRWEPSGRRSCRGRYFTRGNDDDLVPTRPPPSSKGLYEQLNEPRDGDLSSSRQEHRSCSSMPKSCDHAPRLPAWVAGRQALEPAPRARCRCCGRSVRTRPRSSPSRSVRALRASPQCTRARL
jgi:hypothetical protein